MTFSAYSGGRLLTLAAEGGADRLADESREFHGCAGCVNSQLRQVAGVADFCAVGVESGGWGKGACQWAIHAGYQLQQSLIAVGSGGLVHSWAPPEAHLVTGGEAVSTLEVRWPSGTVQTVTAPALNRRVTITEP